MIKSWLLIFFLCATTTLFSQTPRIEQLKEIVAQKAMLPDSTVLSTINDLFEEYYYRRDSTQAAFYSDLLMEEANKRKEVIFGRQGYINKIFASSISLQSNKVAEGRTNIDSLLKITKLENDQLTIARCHIYLGNLKILKDPTDTTFYHFQEALNILNDKDSKAEVAALIGLAHATSNKVGVKEAIPILLIAIKKAKTIGDDILTIQGLNKMSRYQFYLSQYEKASNSTIEIIELAEAGEYYTYDLISTYNRLGDLYWVKNRDIEKARLYSQKAYELGKAEWVSEQVKARTATFLAYYYIVGDTPNLDLAKELLEHSIQLGIDYKLKHPQAIAHFYFGMLYSKKDSFELAYPHYIKGINMSKENNRPHYGLRIQAYLAEEIKQLNIDVPIFIDTIRIKEGFKGLEQKIWFYRIKKDIALKKKDYKKASDIWEKLLKLSIQQQMKASKIDVEEQLLACKLEDEQERSAMQAILLQSTTFQNRLLWGASILATLLLGVFYFLYQTKHQHNKTIIEKNEQISTSLEQISSLNKNLNFKNELLAEKNVIQQNELVEYITLQSNQEQQLKFIQKEIKERINHNTNDITNWQLIHTHMNKLVSGKNEWVHFKRKIESLYPNFFMNLLLKHSNLTDRDQMHCVYILLGMNVNQVAKTLFVSPKSAESTRYRLKKKMNLEATDNLTDYIKRFSFF